jgi:hypothetical protein
MTNFESEMDWDTFGVRGDLLRPYFGQWDYELALREPTQAAAE